MLEICIAVIVLVLVIVRVSIARNRIRKVMQWTQGNRGRRLGYIYFFRGRGEAIWKVKIGRTNNPMKRLAAHRTANPHGVVVLAVFKTRDDALAERNLHDRFARNRIDPNNEWFYVTLDVLLYMWLLNDRALTERINSWLRSSQKSSPNPGR